MFIFEFCSSMRKEPTEMMMGSGAAADKVPERQNRTRCNDVSPDSVARALLPC
jgi:hypothetical protein